MPLPNTIFARLIELFPGAKTSTLRRMLESKRVILNGMPAKSLKHPLTAADRLEVVDVSPVPTKTAPLDEGLRIRHLDADIVIVEKPAGVLTSTDAAEKRPTALAILTDYFLRQNHRNKILLVHRLDKDASGLLVFARNANAFTALKKQFFEHTITRQYDVIVHGIPKKPQARLEHLLIENTDTGEVRITKNMKAGKIAMLDYTLIQTNPAKNLTHLRCTLHTGRKHQIRVQLLAAGHPVCGDPMYGKADEPPHRLALHAGHLSFEHPRTHRKVTFDSPMPGDFTHLLH